MQHIIKMADIRILADVPYFMHSSDSMEEFISPAPEGVEADIRLDIRPVDMLPEIRDVRHADSKRTYVGEGETAGTFFSSYPGKAPYAYVSRRSVHEGILNCDYLPGNEKYMNYAKNLITLMDIEATLLHFNTLILHASLIRHEGKGIIFSAPSGTGKSTQAGLWEQYEDAEVLNGDRAALRKIDGEWHAYGLPYAGTSGIYKNESAPLKAVVALRQAKEDRIRRIQGAEAFRYLYPETLIHRWDHAFEKKAAELLLDVLSDVPVFLLECLPDRDAVTLLKETIRNSL